MATEDDPSPGRRLEEVFPNNFTTEGACYANIHTGYARPKESGLEVLPCVILE